MRFKNYINSFTKRNRLLSDEDMLNMTLGKMLDNEDAILAQHNTIGFPKLEELQSSPNTQWVEPFVNQQGGQDGGYWQSVLEPMYQGSYIPRQPKFDYYHGINGPIPVERTKEGILDNSNYYQEEEPANHINNEENSQTNNENTQVLEGHIEKNEPTYDNVLGNIENGLENLKEKIESTTKKYEGLDLGQAAQKAASKILPYDKVENEYYRNSFKLKDGELLTDRFLEENDVYSLKDISDADKYNYYKEQLAKMYGLDVNDSNIDEQLKDKKIVVPKETSRLYQYAKNSDATKKWIAENYERIKNGEEPIDNSIEFPLGGFKGALNDEKRGLFATLHRADIDNATVNSDGSLALNYKDKYNYEKWDEKRGGKNLKENINNFIMNRYVNLNNRALDQQNALQLEPYAINMPITISKEEIEEILKRNKRKIK